MHIHAAVPFNVPTYPTTKAPSDTPAFTPLTPSAAALISNAYGIDRYTDEQSSEESPDAELTRPKTTTAIPTAMQGSKINPARSTPEARCSLDIALRLDH